MVFRDSLPYRRMILSDLAGPGGAPFVAALPGVITVYLVNLGREGFSDPCSPGFRSTFIHELTHVWQGHHSLLPFSFMIDSLLHQAIALARFHDRHACYVYRTGRRWREYNVEQQASLVEDWYAHGMDPDDDRYRYVAALRAS
jgi:hypothetical protein